MRKLKSIVGVVLIGLMIASCLTACGDDKDKKNGSDGAKNESSEKRETGTANSNISDEKDNKQEINKKDPLEMVSDALKSNNNFTRDVTIKLSFTMEDESNGDKSTVSIGVDQSTEKDEDISHGKKLDIYES